MSVLVKCFLILIVSIFFQSCCFWSSNELGNNIYLLEGDREEDRIIVNCTMYDGRCCQGGDYLVPPSYDVHMQNGEYTEYVDVSKRVEDVILVRTALVKEVGQYNYWIIILNGNDDYDHVVGPLSEERFKADIDSRSINNPF